MYDGIEDDRRELQHGLSTTINAWSKRMKDAHGARQWVTDRQVQIVLERLVAEIEERRK